MSVIKILPLEYQVKTPCEKEPQILNGLQNSPEFIPHVRRQEFKWNTVIGKFSFSEKELAL